MIRTIALTLTLAVASSSLACMGVGEPGQAVRFGEQTNLIVWDAAHGVEHFVRDARFESEGKSLGFIAPTPSRPEIVLAEEGTFYRLASLSPARMRTRGLGSAMGGYGGGVAVVERKRVGGYEASVLLASDPGSLNVWLRANGYAAPRGAERWAAPYIRQGWYFTAFKVVGNETGPIRLSFKTDMPYNPYSVPAENGGAKAGLSLYYVSAGDEVPRIGGRKPWSRPQWSKQLDGDAVQRLTADLKLKEGEVPAVSVLRFYRDGAFGRPDQEDLFFVPGEQASSTPIGAIFAGLGLGAFALGRRKG